MYIWITTKQCMLFEYYFSSFPRIRGKLTNWRITSIISWNYRNFHGIERKASDWRFSFIISRSSRKFPGIISPLIRGFDTMNKNEKNTFWILCSYLPQYYFGYFFINTNLEAPFWGEFLPPRGLRVLSPKQARIFLY